MEGIFAREQGCARWRAHLKQRIQIHHVPYVLSETGECSVGGGGNSKGSKLNLIEITYENEANKEKEREKKSDVNKEEG